MYGLHFEHDETPDNIRDNAVDLVETPFADAIRASVANAIRQNSPMDWAQRSIELFEAKRPKAYALPPRDPMNPDRFSQAEGEFRTKRMLTKEEANAEYSIPGKLNFDGNITEDAAKIIKARKEEEIQTESLLNDAHGIIKNGAMFGTELVTSLLDPLNFAANFIPIVGEARAAQLAARYGKHAMRLMRGGLEGMVGQGMLEPFAYATHNYEMTDYTMYNALQSILMGGLGGAGLHEGIGVIGDAIKGIKLKTAQRMYKAAIGQLAEGKQINISPILDHDPNITNLMGDGIDEESFISSLKSQAVKSGMLPDVDKIAELRKQANIPEEDGKGFVGGTGKTSAEVAEAVKQTDSIDSKVEEVYQHLFGDVEAKLPLDEKISILHSAWGMFEDPAVPFPLQKEFDQFSSINKMAKGIEKDNKLKAELDDQFGNPDWDGSDEFVPERMDTEADTTWSLQHPDQVQTKSDFINDANVEGPHAPEINVESTLDGKNLEKIGEKLGTNEGGTYIDKTTGQKWYVKKMATMDHVQNELLVNLLYRLAGLEVPELRIVLDADGKPTLASKWIDGTTPITKFDNLSPDDLIEIQKGFIVDAWLANWDVLDGLDSGNLHRLPDGGIIRLDQGGGLRYRAGGEPKELDFKVTELETMKDPNLNYKGSQVYGKMVPQMDQISASFLFKITKADIEKVLDLAGYAKGTTERNKIASLLFGRMHYLESKFPDAAKQYHYKNQSMTALFSHADSVALLDSYLVSAHTALKATENMDVITGALQEYQHYSAGLNGWLRKGSPKSQDEGGAFATMKKWIDKAMNSFSFPERVTVWRGIYSGEANKLFGNLFNGGQEFAGASGIIPDSILHTLIGKKVKVKNFMSTSLGSKSAFSSARPIQIKLEVPEGYHAAFPDSTRIGSDGSAQHTSYTNAEVETILPRNTEYYVTRAYYAKDDYGYSASTKLIIEAKIIPKKGPVGKKTKTAAITPEQTMKEVADYHKKESNAADPEPLETMPGVKEPNEVVKPLEIATEKAAPTEIDAGAKKAISEQITALEREIATIEQDIKLNYDLKQVEQEGLSGVTNPEDLKIQKEFIDQLTAEMDGWDAMIVQSKEKLDALKAAFGCVMGNL